MRYFFNADVDAVDKAAALQGFQQLCSSVWIIKKQEAGWAGFEGILISDETTKEVGKLLYLAVWKNSGGWCRIHIHVRPIDSSYECLQPSKTDFHTLVCKTLAGDP